MKNIVIVFVSYKNIFISFPEAKMENVFKKNIFCDLGRHIKAAWEFLLNNHFRIIESFIIIIII